MKFVSNAMHESQNYSPESSEHIVCRISLKKTKKKIKINKYPFETIEEVEIRNITLLTVLSSVRHQLMIGFAFWAVKEMNEEQSKHTHTDTGEKKNLQ